MGYRSLKIIQTGIIRKLAFDASVWRVGHCSGCSGPVDRVSDSKPRGCEFDSHPIHCKQP